MTREQAPARSDFKAWRCFTTRWSDNDVYGHVNNMIFYQWFDSAVNGWLIEQELLDIEQGSPICLVVKTSCTYFAPLTFPQDVEVGLAVVELGRSSIRYSIGIFSCVQEHAAARGEFVHVVVDRESRRPMPIPPPWRAKFELIR